MNIKASRGQKLCAACNTINGARSFKCKNCLQDFAMRSAPKVKPQKSVGKRKLRKEPVSDWTTLNTGDIVKIKQGSGSFFSRSDGERTYLTSGGLAKVRQKETNGFWASYVNIRKNCGEFFVYMGKTCRSPVLSNLVRCPHKLIRIVAKN
jgi:hypothetical protein